MNAIPEKKSKSFVYNSSTFSGCLDIILVEKSDRSLRCSDICLTIGNIKMMNTANKKITMKVNGFLCKHQLSIDGSGNAYFEPIKKVYFEKTKFSDGNTKNEKVVFKDENPGQDMPSTKHNSNNPYQLYSEKDNVKDINDLEVSLCGHLLKEGMSKSQINTIFDKYRKTYADFKENTNSILNDENLMIRINGQVYDSFIGIPKLLSLNLFQKSIGKSDIPKERNKTTNLVNKKDNDFPYFKKSLKPPEDMFEGVCLHKGRNEAKFSFNGNFSSDYEISSRLYYYPYRKHFRVIISDIDGTVTRSDLLGHIMPMVGQDWSHDGIAKLFSNLAKRGYIFIYLSARNIGQAKRTKNYLESIDQGGEIMPDGPVITSTDGLFSSFNREVIQKTPHLFKIEMLRGIYKVFEDNDKNPFYAGFGNRETDAIAYTTLAIETKRIFTINDKSEIKVLKNGNTVNFTDLNKTIDETFPEFDPNYEAQEDEHQVKIRNKTVGNIVHQSLYDTLFKNN